MVYFDSRTNKYVFDDLPYGVLFFSAGLYAGRLAMDDSFNTQTIRQKIKEDL